MPLYALHLGNTIHADDAESSGSYNCLECQGPLQVRGGRKRRHFYHIKRSPSCRLYSKSEDHLILQYQIQSLFPEGQIVLERPFLSIGRVADASWDRYKVVFEIQCSPILLTTVQSRTRDYASLGYSVVWLLDDRLFNRRSASPAEIFLRGQNCYFVHYQKMNLSNFYDQLEILQGPKRVKKGVKLPIDLTRPRQTPKTPFKNPLPDQILHRLLTHRLFFTGDLTYQALLSTRQRPLAITLQNWAFFEKEAASQKKSSFKPSKILLFFWHFWGWLVDKVNS